VIEQLNPMAKEIVQRFWIFATRGIEERLPKRVQVLPTRSQTAMVMAGKVPQVPETQRGDDLADLGGHSEERGGHSGIYAGGVPGEHERLIHDLDSQFGREQTRWTRRAGDPDLLASSPLPPAGIAIVDVCQQEWALAGSRPGRCVQREPGTPMGTHELWQRTRAVQSGAERQQLEESFVELAHQGQAGAALPCRGGQ